jgi:hypothetical protein
MMLEEEVRLTTMPEIEEEEEKADIPVVIIPSLSQVKISSRREIINPSQIRKA